ncbi:hypothetical protein diail_6810 [Diaporthe ilicicola]|nr:hypothetical protein diail_6810 [Diaporthe ilicicola]
MTNHFYGSSLFQARKTDHDHNHRHSLLHGRSANHLRSHAHFHRRQEENETADLDSGDPTITEVVQTISVVQVIDGSGAIIETQTLNSDPQTNLLDAETGSTIDTGFKAVSLTSHSAGAATTSSTATETPISSVDPVSAASETTQPSANPSDVSLSPTSSLPQETTTATTSLPPTLSLPSSSSSPSTFPSLSSTFNSTICDFICFFHVIFAFNFINSFKFYCDRRYLGRKLYGIPVAIIAGHDSLIFFILRLHKRFKFEPALELHIQLKQPHEFLLRGFFHIFQFRITISVPIIDVWYRRRGRIRGNYYTCHALFLVNIGIFWFLEQ